MHELKIEIGEPRIIRGDYYDYGTFGGIAKVGDRLIVSASIGIDRHRTREEILRDWEEEPGQIKSSDDYIMKPTKEDIHRLGGRWYLKSDDGGETWEDYGAPTSQMSELRDGSLYSTGQGMETEEGQSIMVWRSFDRGDTYVGPEYVPVIGPSLESRSEAQHGLNQFGFIGRDIAELDDGTLLVPACVRFSGDTKYRNVIYRSTDQGKSFHYYSTMTMEPDFQNDFGEPNIELLSNGDLISMHRTGSYMPLWQFHSTNGGATWSGPTDPGAHGVSPDMVRLGNGVLACTYGRPGCWIMLSPDGRGNDWTERTCIWNGRTLVTYEEPNLGHVPQRRDDRSECYSCIRESSPGTLLFLFAAPTCIDDSSVTNPWDPKQVRKFSIWGVNINVEIR